MSDKVMYTMYRFYLKKTKELYAYTITKEYKKKFLMGRNPNCFIVHKSKIQDIDFMIFDNDHQDKKLIPIIINSNPKDYMEIIGTQGEEIRMFNEIEEIYTIEEYMRHSLEHSPLNKKYLKALYDIVFFSKEQKPMINSLALFAAIFKDTFECM